MRGNHSDASRRPFQFTIGGLLTLTTWIAIYLALRRSDFRDVELPAPILRALLPVAVSFAVAVVVILGAALIVAYCEIREAYARVLFGMALGECLATATIGWIAVNLPSDQTGVHPYLALAAVVVVGALLGSLGGLIAPQVARMLAK